MIVYDFEVFEYDWLVVFKDLLLKKETVIINDPEKLSEFYEVNKDSLFIGYNNTRYDGFIFKGILQGLRPWYVNDTIINNEDKSKIWKIGDWWKHKLFQYDVMHNFGFSSLKENEGYLGLSIEESDVAWDIGRPLTEAEIEKTIQYCRYDVESTAKLFYETIGDFKIKMELVTSFNLNKLDVGRSNTALIGKILDAQKIWQRDDELDGFDVSSLPINIKNKEVVEFFEKEIDYEVNAEVMVAGVPHILAYGGLHGARENFSYIGEMWLIDVASYYPSMMIEYDYFSRAIPENKKKLFAQMKADRVHLKETDPLKADGYKLILNSTYGILKYEYSPLLDPRQSNNICVTGQLLLIDLIEELEPYMKLVQSNTDGILIIPNEKYKSNIKEIVKDWEARTRMDMEILVAKQIYQKDVNNYVMELENGYVETKGGYVAQYNGGIRKNFRVVDKAVVEYLLHGISPEDYINNEKDLFEFQQITKTGPTFDKTVWYSDEGKKIVNKVNRVYATTDTNFGGIYKVKNETEETEMAEHKMPNSPMNCFVDNKGTEMNIEKLDRQFYIDMTKKRISDYLETS